MFRRWPRLHNISRIWFSRLRRPSASVLEMALCFLLLPGELVLIWSSAVDVPSLRRLCHALARSLTAPHMLVVHDQL